MTKTCQNFIRFTCRVSSVLSLLPLIEHQFMQRTAPRYRRSRHSSYLHLGCCIHLFTLWQTNIAKQIPTPFTSDSCDFSEGKSVKPLNFKQSSVGFDGKFGVRSWFLNCPPNLNQNPTLFEVHRTPKVNGWLKVGEKHRN